MNSDGDDVTAPSILLDDDAPQGDAMAEDTSADFSVAWLTDLRQRAQGCVHQDSVTSLSLADRLSSMEANALAGEGWVGRWNTTWSMDSHGIVVTGRQIVFQEHERMRLRSRSPFATLHNSRALEAVNNDQNQSAQIRRRRESWIYNTSHLAGTNNATEQMRTSDAVVEVFINSVAHQTWMMHNQLRSDMLVLEAERMTWQREARIGSGIANNRWWDAAETMRQASERTQRVAYATLSLAERDSLYVNVIVGEPDSALLLLVEPAIRAMRSDLRVIFILGAAEWVHSQENSVADQMDREARRPVLVALNWRRRVMLGAGERLRGAMEDWMSFQHAVGWLWTKPQTSTGSRSSR